VLAFTDPSHLTLNPHFENEDSQMKFTTFAAAAALTLGSLTAAHAYDPKATIADLDARLSKIGVG